MKISKEDVFILLLSKIKSKRVPANALKIHEAVYKLQDDVFYSFDKFNFSGIEPYSEDLNNFLFFLGVSDILQDLSPEYDDCLISVPENRIPKINETAGVNLDVINALAEKFEEMLNQ